MTDKQMHEEVANLWLDLGGDANGFVYNWRDIYELLKEKEEEDE